MNNKIRKILVYIGVGLLFLAVYAALIAAIMGLEMLAATPNISSGIITIVMVVGLVVIFAINAVRVRKMSKKYNDEKNLSDIFDEFEDSYDRAVADYKTAEKKLVKTKNTILLYRILLTAYFMLIALVASLSFHKDNPLMEVTIVIAVLACVYIPAIWLPALIPSKSDEEYFQYELDRKEYPLLYKVVEDAEKALSCNRPFKLFMCFGDSLSVSSSENCINIRLDCEETYILTRDELYQMMVHEIAHVVNSDTKRTRSLSKFSEFMERDLISSTTFFLSSVYVEFCMQREIYFRACNKFYEQNADKAVLEHGNGAVALNATAKGMLLGMYRGESVPEMTFHIYENEKIPEDYYVRDLEVFKKYLEKNSEKWNFILTHRLQSRVDTHPTFKMRMEMMGVDSYDYTAKETDPAYCAELEKLMKWGCRALCETQAEYEMSRKQYYLPLKEKWENYKNDVAAGKVLSVQEKTAYLKVLYSVDHDECLRIANEILQERPNSAFANMYKGLILAERLDKGCVDCLYTAAQQNFNFSEQALNTVGEFACNSGDEELLQYYRDRAKNDTLTAMSSQNELTIHENDKLVKNSLPEEHFNTIRDFIVKIGGNVLMNLYSVSRIDNDKVFTVYLPEFDLKDFDRCDRIFGEVFEYLDAYNDGVEDMHFALYSQADVNVLKQMKKVNGALIYSAKINQADR